MRRELSQAARVELCFAAAPGTLRSDAGMDPRGCQSPRQGGNSGAWRSGSQCRAALSDRAALAGPSSLACKRARVSLGNLTHPDTRMPWTAS